VGPTCLPHPLFSPPPTPSLLPPHLLLPCSSSPYPSFSPLCSGGSARAGSGGVRAGAGARVADLATMARGGSGGDGCGGPGGGSEATTTICYSRPGSVAGGAASDGGGPRASGGPQGRAAPLPSLPLYGARRQWQIDDRLVEFEQEQRNAYRSNRMQHGRSGSGGPPSSSPAATPSACLSPYPSLSGDSSLPGAPPRWLRHGRGGEDTAATTGARTVPLRSGASARSSSPLLRATGWGRVPSLGTRPLGRSQTVVGPSEDGGGSRIPLDLEDTEGIVLFPVSLDDTATTHIPSSLSSRRLSRVPVRMVLRQQKHNPPTCTSSEARATLHICIMNMATATSTSRVVSTTGASRTKMPE
jgi:hypothetical protein